MRSLNTPEGWVGAQENFLAIVQPDSAFVAPGSPSDLDWEIELHGNHGESGRLRLYRFEFDESDEMMMWGSRVRYWADIAINHGKSSAFDDLLKQALKRIRARHREEDRTLQVRWPSGDRPGSAVLSRTGFQALLHLTATGRSRGILAGESIHQHVRFATANDTQVATDMIAQLHALESERGVFRFPPTTVGQIGRSVSTAVAERRLLLWDSGPGALGCIEFGFEKKGSWIGGAVKGAPVAVLSGLWVIPEARRREIGTALVMSARVASAESVALAVYSAPNSSAARFWGRVGFDPIWTTWRMYV